MNRLVLLVLCACGGGPGSFTGSVQSSTFQVADAVFLGGQEVWLSSASGFCKLLQDNTYPMNGTILKIAPRPPKTGDFDVLASTTVDQTAALSFFKLDATCTPTVASQASTGTLTIQELDTMHATGKFTATFGNSDQTSGTFNATFCDAPTIYPTPKCQ